MGRTRWIEAQVGCSVVYAVAVNCLKNPTLNPNPHPKPNPIRNPTTNPIPNPNPNPTNPIPYSSGNLLLRRKLHLARVRVRVRRRILQAIYCYGVNYSTPPDKLPDRVPGSRYPATALLLGGWARSVPLPISSIPTLDLNP